MAQPIRSSGWRPLTSRSNARGTSGTRPGKRCAISGGGVPDGVGRAPDHDAAGLVEFRRRQPRRPLRRRVEKQMRPPGIQRDQARQLRIAGHRAQRLVGAPLETVAEEMRDRRRGQRGRHLGAAGPGQEQRGRDHQRARARRSPPPRPSAGCAGAADRTRSPVATIAASPDISSATPAPPTTRSRSNRPAIRLPASAGRDREEIDEIARQRIDRRPIDDRRILGVAGEPAGVEHHQQHDAGHREQQAAEQAAPVQRPARRDPPIAGHGGNASVSARIEPDQIGQRQHDDHQQRKQRIERHQRAPPARGRERKGGDQQQQADRGRGGQQQQPGFDRPGEPGVAPALADQSARNAAATAPRAAAPAPAGRTRRRAN